jgi:hypothetical protein
LLSVYLLSIAIDWDNEFSSRDGLADDMERSFHTDLNTDECLKRLSLCDREYVFSLCSTDSSSSKQAPETDGEYKFRFQKRRHWYSRRDVVPIFNGNLCVQDAGTRITGHFSLIDSARSWFILWSGCCILVGGASFVVSFVIVVGAKSTLQENLLGLVYIPVVTAGAILFGIVMDWLTRFVALSEQHEIIDFLQKTLEAQKGPSLAVPSKSSD